MSETFGNGLWLQNTFDPLTGEAATRQAGSGGQTTNVQNLAYHWDKAGNLQDRQDLRQGLTETFGYDALYRLTSTSGPGAQALTIVYDAIGNVTSRTDLSGTFTYDPVRKHAVTSAGGVSYGYDANGNMSTRNGATIAWTSYNLPASLSASGYTASFNYAPDRSRWRQVATYTGATETTIYVAGLVEKLTTSARVHWKHRIAVPAGEVQVIRRSDGTNDVFYITTDHLGSTDTVTDASATVLARESFGAWGARRAANWQGSPSPGEWQQIANTTRRGYTGHEQLDNVLLVHMNGRVYDPAIGRFMSADPFVGCVTKSQSWNRYSYTESRPLVYTDPTGHFSRGDSMHWKVVAVSPGWDPAAQPIEEIVTTASAIRQLWSSLQDDLRRLKLQNVIELDGSGDRNGGGAGGDRSQDSRERRDQCMRDCKAAVASFANTVGAMVGGAVTGYQASRHPYGAIFGAVAGLVADRVLDRVLSGGAGSATVVSVGVAVGGVTDVAVARIVGRATGTALTGSVAGGMLGGLLASDGMSAPFGSGLGGLVAGIGASGKSVLANMVSGSRQGLTAGLLGAAAVVAISSQAPKICNAIRGK